MPPSNNQSTNSLQDVVAKLKPGLIFVVIILGALIAFEVFNYSTTDLALRDLLGDLTFAGIAWSTILALAFCGIDFAGIARLFTSEQDSDEPKEVWYLFGAWLLAATMNAILTWWGVSMAVANHTAESTAVVDSKMITNVVPVFVAVMVWVIRILIIGTLSVSMDRLLHEQNQTRANTGNANRSRPQPQPISVANGMNATPSASPARSNGSMRPAPTRVASPSPRPASSISEPSLAPEPTYHKVR